MIGEILHVLYRVNITGTTIKKNVYGSKSGIGQGNESTVEINNGRIEGRGNVRYTGLGGLVRKVVGERWYIDGSVNVGGYGIEYENEINSINKEDIGYKYKGMYVGGHVGCGYKVEASKNINIDIIGKILLTRQEGKE